MNIQMIGIDHSNAPVSIREKFAFTKKAGQQAMQTICRITGVSGCVLLSTCNRTEIYASTENYAQISLYEVLCDLKEIDSEDYKNYFVERKGEEAASHLFYLTAGMESRIIGEDQILMQVKDALNQARVSTTTDKVLEVLFRMAVTAGKKVKTDITFSHENSSAVHGAIAQLKHQGKVFAGKECLVIGNGEMGRLTANLLKEQGAHVTVTVRQYRSGEIQIPEGCDRINYGERYERMASCDYIVSATSSPNLTVTRDEVERLHLAEPKVFLDLAVPRDIDLCLDSLDNVERYDIDSFSVDARSEELIEQMKEAEEILQQSIQEFISWYQCRDYVPLIHEISRAAAADVNWRMGRFYGQADLEAGLQERMETSVEKVTAKVFEKLLFKLRDSVDADMLRECLDAFCSAYPGEIDLSAVKKKEQ